MFRLLLPLLLLAAPALADDYGEEPPAPAQSIVLGWDGARLSYDGPDDAAIWFTADACTITVNREPRGTLAIHIRFDRWPVAVTLDLFQHDNGGVDVIGRVTAEAGDALGAEDCESYPTWADLFGSRDWLAADARQCLRAAGWTRIGN